MRCLSNIPKNLIRIFLVLCALSFLYIGYILSNEQYHKDFLNQDRQFENQYFVHPFFRFMQQNYDPSSRFKSEFEGGWNDN